MSDGNNEAWADLINGLGILRTGAHPARSPLHCENGLLTVISDPEKFSELQLRQLELMGFFPDDDGTFYSRRFASA